jgi:hypothetical protein
VEASVVASTAMAESSHATGSVSAEAAGLDSSTDPDASADDDACGEDDASADGEREDVSATASALPPPRTAPMSHQMSASTVMTMTTTAARRIQYTVGGSGPDGCMSVLMGTHATAPFAPP